MLSHTLSRCWVARETGQLRIPVHLRRVRPLVRVGAGRGSVARQVHNVVQGRQVCCVARHRGCTTSVRWPLVVRVVLLVAGQVAKVRVETPARGCVIVRPKPKVPFAEHVCLVASL